jgi:hypothetical protein
VGGTNIEVALKTTLKALREGAGGENRAIVLVTDGDEVHGSVAGITKELKEENIPIITIGMGDATLGTFIQLEDNIFIQDADGEKVRSRLNETLLRTLSTETGGVYVTSTVVQDGLAAVSERIEQLIPEENKSGTSMQPIQRYQIPLFIAVILLLIRMVLPERASRRAGASSGLDPTVALMILLSLSTTSYADEKGDTSKLANKVEQKSVAGERIQSSAERAYKNFLAGVAQYAEGDYGGAKTSFEDALNEKGITPEIAAAAFQNLGVLAHQAGRDKLKPGEQKPDDAINNFERAATYYREAMRHAPETERIGANQEQALRDIKMAEKIKELQKQRDRERKEAEKQTTKAHEEQQQANQEQEQSKQQQKQEQAKSSAEKARDAAQKSAEASQQLGDNEQQAKSEDMKRQLDDAMKDQEKAMDKARPKDEQQAAAKDAERKLKNAMMKPDDENSEKSDEPGSKGQDDNKSAENKEDKNAPQKKPSTTPGEKPEDARGSEAEQAEGKIEEGEYSAILTEMQEEEKEFNKMLKAHQKEQQGRKGTVRKNW